MVDHDAKYNYRNGVSYPAWSVASDYGAYGSTPKALTQGQSGQNYFQTNTYGSYFGPNARFSEQGSYGHRSIDDLALVARNSQSQFFSNYNRPASAICSSGSATRGEPLYPASLLALERQTQENLSHLRGKILSDYHQQSVVVYDKRYGRADGAQNPVNALYNLNESENRLSLFLPSREILRSGWRKSTHDEDNESESSFNDVTSPGNFCYLCSTLDEHQKHLLRESHRPKSQKVPKPRIKYVAPPPKIKKKDKDENTEEEKESVAYRVQVKTGKQKDSGTSANVFVQLKGTGGLSKRKQLTRRHAVRFAFGVNTNEVFYIKTTDIGRLEALLVEHDGKEKHHGWFLEEIALTNIVTNDHYIFPCNQWLSMHVAEKQIMKVLKPSSSKNDRTNAMAEYEVHVNTGTVSMAGTNANVFITFYGQKGTSSKMHLKGRHGSKSFQKGSKDVFNLSLKDPGPLTAIRIEHDNAGTAPGWFLEKVTVLDRSKDCQYVFPCDQWLALDEGDGKISRTLEVVGRSKRKGDASEIEYKVEVLTGDVMSAGTDANVFITLYGRKRTSAQIHLKNKATNNFERKSKDTFYISTEDVGKIEKLKIEHDNTGIAAGWFLDKVIITNVASKKSQVFPCGQWLAKDEGDKSLSKILLPTESALKDSMQLSNESRMKTYEVRVVTGDKTNAGTDANVFLTLCGLNGTSSKIPLKNSSKSTFERGKTDVFEIKAEDVGEISSVCVEHDNSGIGPGWFLDKIMISDHTVYEFPCGRWLAADEDDGKTSRKLYRAKPEKPSERSLNRSEMLRSRESLRF